MKVQGKQEKQQPGKSAAARKPAAPARESNRVTKVAADKPARR